MPVNKSCSFLLDKITGNVFLIQLEEYVALKKKKKAVVNSNFIAHFIKATLGYFKIMILVLHQFC